ncbi:MAG: hypothetical protein DRN03_06085 [Thermoplasmata archaeon]|nr:MAG: hypothetical protein DRN03_06085 [Thermoplasmata archaeon]
MPTAVSPAVGVTVWGVELDFSVAPLSVYMGDTMTYSGILTETDGTTSYAVPSKPIDTTISNASVTSVIAHTDYTCDDGTYTLYWTVDETAVYGDNYFYSSSSW